MSKRLSSLWMFGLLLLACGKSTPPDQPASASTSAGAERAAHTETPSTFAEQVALGGKLYGQKCASCHGAAGEGTSGAPAVVGLANGALPLAPRPGSARSSQFRTVADVATFVVSTMPPKAPGSLSPEEYWAILAFDLSANGVTLEQTLTPELAPTLALH